MGRVLGRLTVLFGGIVIVASVVAASWTGLDSPGSGFGVIHYLAASGGLIVVILGAINIASRPPRAPVNPRWRDLSILLLCMNLLLGPLLVFYPQQVGPPLTQIHLLLTGARDLHGPLLEELLNFFETRAEEKWAENQARFDLDRPGSAENARDLVDAITKANRDLDETKNILRVDKVTNLQEQLIGEFNASRRYRVRFQNDLGLTIEGILSVPRSNGLYPLIIIPNGMSSTPEKLFLIDSEDYHHGVACQFESDYIVFALHIPSFPDFEYEVTMHNRMNWAAEVTGLSYRYYETVDKVVSALNYLETRSEIDPDRIAIYGISLGGETAIDSGVTDERISVIAASGTNVFTPTFQYIFDEWRYLYPYNYQKNKLSRPDAGTRLLAVYPRKLIIELNREDTTGNFNAALHRAQQVKRIYSLLGHEDHATIITFDHAKSAIASHGHEMQVTGVRNQIDRWFGIQPSSAPQCDASVN